MMYFDHNATTPVLPEAARTMQEAAREQWGNPSSVHAAGRRARSALDRAREGMAALLGAAPEELVFTSGATEANNLALKGFLRHKGRGHALTTAVEHPSVLEPLRALQKEGFDLSVVGVDAKGRVKREELEAALRPETILLSLQWANNETGTLQDVAAVSAWAKEKGLAVHLDAAQAVGRVPVTLKELPGVDMLSLSAHKFYGPKGAGALFVRKALRLDAMAQGGKHERSLRPGTENVPAILGMAKALEIAVGTMPQEAVRLKNLKKLLKERLSIVEDMEFNGDQEQCLPNTMNICFHGVDANSLLMNLDLEGLCVSTGAACSSGSIEPSPVLMAMKGEAVAKSSIRISMGRSNNEDQVNKLADILMTCVKKIKEVTGGWDGRPNRPRSPLLLRAREAFGLSQTGPVTGDT